MSGQFITIFKRTNNLQICTYTNAIKENYKPHTEPLYQPTFTVTTLKIRDVATSRPSVGLDVVSTEIRSHVSDRSPSVL